jgi:hypothetical protein
VIQTWLPSHEVLVTGESITKVTEREMTDKLALLHKGYPMTDRTPHSVRSVVFTESLTSRISSSNTSSMSGSQKCVQNGRARVHTNTSSRKSRSTRVYLKGASSSPFSSPSSSTRYPVTPAISERLHCTGTAGCNL